MNPQDMSRLLLQEGDLVQVSSKRGAIVLPVQGSAEVAVTQAFMAMHWGSEYLSGQSSQGTRLAGVNALTTSAYCPSSKQPELKHAAVKIVKADMPWSLLAMAWLPASEVLNRQRQLQALMGEFPFASCVPFSNNAPLSEPGRERCGVLFRAAAHEPASAELLARIEQALDLSGDDVLRYSDRQKGQHRSVRLQRKADNAELVGLVLAGDTSAQAWIKTLLQDELPAQAYGRLLLLPGAQAPVAVQSRGKPVCSCMNVTDAAITAQLAHIHASSGHAAAGSSQAQALSALQSALGCGTQCGSCLPELKRLVRASSPPASPVSQEPDGRTAAVRS
jgi:assimilatory nitrate reductase catalytic subunit